MLKYYVAVVVGLLAPCLGTAALPEGFTLKTGIGYDLLSQRYFLDSLNFAGSDTVLTRWALTTNYLNDVKARLELGYRFQEGRTLELRSAYEQTRDVLRLKVNGDWSEETVLGHWYLRGQVDWREQYRQSEQALGSYVSGATSAKLKIPLGLTSSLWGQFHGDGTAFYKDHGHGYDYMRLGGKFGLEQELGLLSVLTVNGFFQGRSVLDSQTLDYRSYGAEGMLSGSFGRSDLDMLARWEQKDYSRPGSSDDYSRLGFDGRNRVALGGGFVARQRLDLELAWYDPSDELNNSYRRLILSFLGGMVYGGFEFAVGPDVRVLEESSSDTSFAEDYFETGGLLDASYLSTSGLFLSLESRLGYRQLEFQNEFQSDFVFYELSAMGDCTFFQRINLNLLISVDWEWHEIESADNRVMLLSTNLSYSF